MLIYTLGMYQTKGKAGKPKCKPSRRSAHGTAARVRAKVFWTGRSQAVRLPKEMRFSTSEVTIRRDGVRLIMEPLEVERDAHGWPKAFWALAGAAPVFDVGDRRIPHERRDILAR
jgi:virulence-associated protein VagC